MAFSEARRQGFFRVLRFLPPFLHRFNASANKIKLNKYDLNSAKLNCLSCPFVPRGTWHNKLHVISARCVAHEFAKISHDCARVGFSSRRSEEIVKKSRIAPLNAIIIIIIIIAFSNTVAIETELNTMWYHHHHHLRHDRLHYFLSYLSRSLADRWGTTVDFTTSFLHFWRLHCIRVKLTQ